MASLLRLLISSLVPLAGAMFTAPSVSAALPQPLSPAARWSLDVEPDSCALARTFGSGPLQIVIQLEAFGPGDGMTFSMIGLPFDKYTRTGPLDLRFLPDGALSRIEPEAVRRIHVMSNGQPVSAILLYVDLAGRKKLHPGQELPPLPDAVLARMNALSIDLGGGADYELQLGSMLTPIKALRGCVDNMVRRWGFDPAAGARPGGRPEPLGHPGDWATDNDYPADGLARGIESDVHFRLSIDPGGQVTECIIQDRFPAGGFAELTCKLVRVRARFRPALDASGNPVASYYVNNVRWRIPHR